MATWDDLTPLQQQKVAAVLRQNAAQANVDLAGAEVTITAEGQELSVPAGGY